MAKGTKKHYDTKGATDGTPDKELNPCVKYVTESWDSWDFHWGTKLAEFETFYDRWWGKPPKRDKEWQAQFHKKLTWQAEKTLVARFHSALFPTSAPIETDATEVRDELQAILAKSLVAHWFKIGMFSKEFLSSMRSAAIYGTGFLEDDWYIRTEPVSERVDKEVDDYRPMVDAETGANVLDENDNVRSTKYGTKSIQTVESKTKVVEDRYRVRKANIYAWRIHPNKLSDDDDLPVIKQEFVTYGDLEEREREAQKLGYQSFENMEDIRKDKYKAKEEDKKRLMKDGIFYDEKNPSIELLHYWGYYKDEEDKKAEKKSMWITIVNRRHILRKWDNPRWDKKSPLFHIIWTEDEKPSYYGIGLAQTGGDSEDRANNVINTRTDIKKKISRGGGWYNSADKKIKKKHLTSNVPGLWRPCTDTARAAVPDIPIPLTPDDYKEEETAVNDHREVTGATTSLNPAADKKQMHDTLGGMQLMLSQSIQKLRPDLAMMEMMGIRRAANRAFLMTRQNVTKPMMIELVASQEDKQKLGLVDSIYELSPRQIIGKVNFYCTGLSESIEKGQNIDKLMKFAEMTAKIPPLQMITNYQGIAKRIGLWLGFEDIQEFIKMNPFDPLAAQPQQPQGAPGQQGQPGQPGQQPQGGGNGGLPPQVLAQIASRMGQGQ